MEIVCVSHWFILCAVLYPTTAVKLVGSVLDSFNNNIKDEDGDLIVWGYKVSTVFAVMIPFMAVSAVCFWARIWVLKLLGERLVARLRARVMKTYCVMTKNSLIMINTKLVI